MKNKKCSLKFYTLSRQSIEYFHQTETLITENLSLCSLLSNKLTLFNYNNKIYKPLIFFFYKINMVYKSQLILILGKLIYDVIRGFHDFSFKILVLKVSLIISLYYCTIFNLNLMY